MLLQLLELLCAINLVAKGDIVTPLSLPIYLSPIKLFGSNYQQPQYDELLLINVKIGTPPQNFNLTLDYNYASSYVFAESACPWDTCQCYDPSQRHYFNASASSTFVQTNTYWTYGLGDPYAGAANCFYLYEGTAYIPTDSWQLGGNTRKSIPFVYAQNASNLLAPSWPSDGILGVAPWNTWSPDGNSSTINSLLLPYTEKVFSVFVQKPILPITLPTLAGYMTLGGKDTEHCSTWTTLQPSPDYAKDGWSAYIDYVILGSKVLDQGNSVTFTSTSAFIYSPVTDTIVEQLGAEFDFDSEQYVVDCDQMSTFPNMTFMLSGNEYTLKATDYVYQTIDSERSSNTCTLLFLDSTSGGGLENIWIFGTTISRQYCLAFDLTQQTVAMAKTL